MTIKTIAELSGVSRGTVDRVLNNRGRVNAQTEHKIRQIAKQLGYIPNVAGKALSAKKKSITIGVIFTSEGNAFFDEIKKGIEQAQKEIADYGVTVLTETMRGYNPQVQLDLINKLQDKISALVINPISDPIIAQKIDELVDSDIFVITINTDIENSKRHCYVGSNYITGGETACGMLGMITSGKEANTAIITGSTKVLGHSQRIKGFRNVIKSKYPHIKYVEFAETNDDEIQAYKETKKILKNQPNLDAIFIVAGGVYGVCRAIIEMGQAEKLTVICFDSVPKTIEMMEKGIIKVSICQQPYTQGYKSIQIVFDYLIKGIKPDKQIYYTKNEIKIVENLYNNGGTQNE